MSRIRTLALSAAAAMLNVMGAHGMVRGVIQRTSSDTKIGRQMVSKGYRSRSKYMPHQGAKERERAARSYMQHYFLIDGPIQTDPLRLRAAPIVQVISKREFYAQPF
jgi:hypothetical protein